MTAASDCQAVTFTDATAIANASLTTGIDAASDLTAALIQENGTTISA